MNDIFNNRELAIGIWFVVLFLMCVFIKDIRRTLPQLFKALLNWKLIVWFSAIIFYNGSIIYLMRKIGIWDISLLKNSILWILFSGVYSGIQLATDVKEEKSFKSLILENISLVFIIGYISNIYSFSLWLEIILQPLIALIILLEQTATREKDAEIVRKVMAWIQVFFGFLLIMYNIYSLVTDKREWDQIFTIRDFILPIVLMVAFIPFLYLQQLFIIYENIFVRLEIGKDKDNTFKKYAKLKIIGAIKLNLKELKSFYKDYAIKLLHIDNDQDLKNLIIEFKRDY